MSRQKFAAIEVLACLLATSLVAPSASAQQGDRLAAVKASLQKSTAELHQYQWVETTVVSINGEEKSRTQDSCYYGADGAVQKTPIGEPPQTEGRQPRGLRGKIVDHKKEEISDSAKQAVALVKEYVPPDPSKIEAAKDAGNLSVVPPDSQGVAQLVIKNYLKAGDSLTMAVNAAANTLAGVTVATYTDEAKDAVDLKVAFGSFADGTLYPETIHLDVKSEDLAVEITNSGYKKMGS